MNQMEKKVAARSLTIAALSKVFDEMDAVQFGDASWAVLQEIDGQEVWTEITVKAKAFTPTKVSPAFDPFEVAEEWKAEKEAKAQEKADKAKAKADKIARDKAAREAKKKATEEKGE